MALVSIGIPTRNRSAFLVDAIESVLAQTYRNIEVIVSDNASTDDTVERVTEIRDPRVKLLRQTENLGMVGNFNACLQAARGTLFLMLSDDDLLEPQAVELLSKPFLEGRNGVTGDRIGLTWCPCVIINAAKESLWSTEAGPAVETSASLILGLFHGRRGPRFCSVMVRTADALAAGGFDEARYGALCDTANWGKAALRYEYAACIEAALVRNMVHPKSCTSQGVCSEWQTWGKVMGADLGAEIRKQGISEKKLRAANRHLIADLTVTILLPNIGEPGWPLYVCREILRARRYLFTPFVARRALRDGWKILRFRKKHTSGGAGGAACPSSSLRAGGTACPTTTTTSEHLIRYLVVGGFNTLFGYATYAGLTRLLEPMGRNSYILANAVVSPFNITVAFFLHKKFSFQSKAHWRAEYMRCLAVYASSMALSFIGLSVVVTALRAAFGLERQAPYLGAALLAVFGVIFNFVGNERFSFRKPKDPTLSQARIEDGELS